MSDDKEDANYIIHKSIILFILGFVALIIGSEVGPKKFAELIAVVTFIAAFLFLIWGISLRGSATQSSSSGFIFWSLIIGIVSSVIGAFIYAAMTGK